MLLLAPTDSLELCLSSCLNFKKKKHTSDSWPLCVVLCAAKQLNPPNYCVNNGWFSRCCFAAAFTEGQQSVGYHCRGCKLWKARGQCSSVAQLQEAQTSLCQLSMVVLHTWLDMMLRSLCRMQEVVLEATNAQALKVHFKNKHSALTLQLHFY